MRKNMNDTMQNTAASDGREYYGFHRVAGGWVYREWAPGAGQVFLAGDFNGWNWSSHPLLDLGNGSWVLFLPGENALWNGCKVRISVDGVLGLPSGTRQIIHNISECGEITDGGNDPSREGNGYTGFCSTEGASKTL